MTKPGAFFLDRDGTINFDRVYINDPNLMELIPGAAEAIKKIFENGYKLIVVTNQSGIGRGIINPEVLPELHLRLNELLVSAGAPKIEFFAICPHHPDDGCSCRKPGLDLVKNAVQELDIDLEKSFFVGDSHVDILCGNRAGCTSILVRTGKGAKVEEQLGADSELKNEPPNYVADDLLAAVNWALEQN